MGNFGMKLSAVHIGGFTTWQLSFEAVEPSPQQLEQLQTLEQLPGAIKRQLDEGKTPGQRYREKQQVIYVT